MKIEENRVFSDTKKTVIFIHPTARFVIDKSIMAEAVYIKLAKKDKRKSGKRIIYYLHEMAEAAKSEKNYMIMEYEPLIGTLIEALMRAPEQYNFCNWHFYTFFHADNCPEGALPDPMYNINDEKLDVLLGFHNYYFIWKYTIPVDYNLTLTNLQKLKKDYSEPQTVKELRRLAWNVRKGIKPQKIFPFYEPDYEKLMAYADRQKTNH